MAYDQRRSNCKQSDAEPDIEVVAEAGDGKQAIEEAGRLRPDVAVIDVRMPLLDGVEATRQITADGFSAAGDTPISVLILTNYHADDAVYGALRAGASGVLLKDAAPVDLATAVRASWEAGCRMQRSPIAWSSDR